MKIQAQNSENQLIDIVQAAFPDSSKTTVRSWIKHGRVTVNGQVEVKANAIIQQGAEVELHPKPRPRTGPVEILYEDKDIVVVYKPSGIVSVATDYDQGESVHSWVKRRYPGTLVYVIHRLDKETSGVMMFALSERAFISLKEQLKNREVKRVYSAVVEGNLTGQGVWEDYLLEDKSTYVMRIVTPSHRGAERAETVWRSIIPGERYSLLECTLNTGKKNQIRVQAAHRGYPIAGDAKYRATYSKKEVFNKRICLHAKELSFTHPHTQRIMNFSCPEPDFFSTLALHS